MIFCCADVVLLHLALLLMFVADGLGGTKRCTNGDGRLFPFTSFNLSSMGALI